jgi:tricarballylate dehydrogenase
VAAEKRARHAPPPFDTVTGPVRSPGRPTVVVIGGGNAGLCAAIAAREAGSDVSLVERDPIEWRGGNSKYTRNLRCADDPKEGARSSYSEEALLRDLVEVTGDGVDLEMARFTVHQSITVPAWMERHGVAWQKPFRGTLQLGGTNRFFLGGGKALVNTYYLAAERAGVQIHYDALVEELEPGSDGISLVVNKGGELSRLQAAAVVVAAGGFESNIEWLKQYWGEGADNYVVRGTRSNDGRMLQALFDCGAMRRGNERGFHAVAVDARSPRWDGGIVTRVDSIPFGIVVNRNARRFYDEGENIWPKRYAVWGRLVAEQPGQVAYSIFDSRVDGLFIPPMYPAYTAAAIVELAAQLQLDAAALEATVAEYNRKVTPGDAFDPTRLDARTTTGLSPPKTNWAIALDRPPFRAYPLRPGITFTYLGVAVDQRARVLKGTGEALPGLYAAGEIMAGNVLREGYLGGFGMTIGTVFGCIAGWEAARHIRAH